MSVKKDKDQLLRMCICAVCTRVEVHLRSAIVFLMTFSFAWDEKLREKITLNVLHTLFSNVSSKDVT